MNPYSHLVIAAQLESDIQPVSRAEYYWGAVAPDVRYVAGMRRAQTHIPPEEIIKFFKNYPHLEAFIQGYLVHRVTDMLDVNAFLRQRLFFRPILSLAPGRLIPLLLETYYIETFHLDVPLAGTPNAMLRDLYISDEDTHTFATAIQAFTAAPSAEGALEFLQVLRKGGNPRVEKYAQAAKIVSRYRRVIPGLFGLANLKRLNQQLVEALKNEETLKKTVFKTLR